MVSPILDARSEPEVFLGQVSIMALDVPLVDSGGDNEPAVESAEKQENPIFEGMQLEGLEQRKSGELERDERSSIDRENVTKARSIPQHHAYIPTHARALAWAEHASGPR